VFLIAAVNAGGGAGIKLPSQRSTDISLNRYFFSALFFSPRYCSGVPGLFILVEIIRGISVYNRKTGPFMGAGRNSDILSG
jgi:hypothetical protein